MPQLKKKKSATEKKEKMACYQLIYHFMVRVLQTLEAAAAADLP